MICSLLLLVLLACVVADGLWGQEQAEAVH
jgi:hypothetical protein